MCFDRHESGRYFYVLVSHLNRCITAPSVQHYSSKGVPVAPQIKPGAAMEGCFSWGFRLDSNASCINPDFPAGVIAVADCQGGTSRGDREESMEIVWVGDAGRDDGVHGQGV